LQLIITPLPLLHDMPTTIAEPAIQVGQFALPFAGLSIIAPRETATHARAIGIDAWARPPPVHPMATPELSNGVSRGGGGRQFFE